MILINLKKIIFIIFFFLFNISFLNAATSSNGINVNLNINYCNFDTICDSLENYSSCPSDCAPTCNFNNICDIGEDISQCPFDCSPPPQNTTSGSYISNNIITNLITNTSYTSANIRWATTFPSSSVIKWGSTNEKKDGIIINNNFATDHNIVINNLKDGTNYYFSIEIQNYYRVVRKLDNQTFITKFLPDVIAPGNPTNVKASSGTNGITITWNNPLDLDFDYVRVVKNLDRFHNDPYVGKLVYEGNGKYFVDSNVVENKKYYYTLFSRDKNGNFSSGSIISLFYNPQKSIVYEPVVIPMPTIPKYTEEVPVYEYKENDKDIDQLIKLFLISQNEKVYEFKLGKIYNFDGINQIYIKTNDPAYTDNSELWIEILNSKREIIGKYFFTKDKDVDGYITATIPLFDKSGYYSVSIHKYLDGFEQIINQGAFNIGEVMSISKEEGDSYIYWIIIIFILILLFIFFVFTALRRKEKQKAIVYEDKIEGNLLE